MTAALQISNLQTWYGESHILHDVNLTVQPGEVVTLLGRNGAGRTTTCLLYTSPSPRDRTRSRMPSSA